MRLNKAFLGTPLKEGHPQLDGLVAWWPFLEGAGGTVFDYSGNKNDGTLTNMAFPGVPTSGWGAGRLVAFDDVDDHIAVDYSPSYDILTEITVTAWFNVRTFPGAGHIGRDDLLGSGDRIWKMGANDVGPGTDAFFAEIFGANNGGFVFTSQSFSANTPHHVAMTYASGFQRDLYVDGILQDTRAVTGTMPQSANIGLRLGARIDDNEFFSGKLDDVRIYNKYKIQAEVRDIMHKRFDLFADPLDIAMLAQLGRSAWYYRTLMQGDRL